MNIIADKSESYCNKAHPYLDLAQSVLCDGEHKPKCESWPFLLSLTKGARAIVMMSVGN